MNYPRIIKIRLPSNEFLNFQIPENETNIKGLLSTLTNISTTRIKGIRDSKGNYFTLSSLTKNIKFFQPNEDIYYELVVRNENNSLIDKKYQNKKSEKINNFEKNQEHLFEKYFGKKNNFHKRTTSMNELSHFDFQKFSNYLLDYLTKKQIGEKQFFELNKMMNEKNKELITQFQFFLNGKITNENFLILLNLFYENRIKKQIFIPKDKIKKEIYENDNEEILEKMKNFFQNEEFEILKEIINSENANIFIRKYKTEGNLGKLIIFFQEEIKRFKNIVKPKKSESSLNLNDKLDKLKLQKKTSDKKNGKRHNSVPDNIIIQDKKDSVKDKISEFKVEDEKENKNNNNDYCNNDNNNNNEKKNKKSEKIFSKIKKHLNEPFKYLIQYFFENNKNEYNEISQVYLDNKKLKIKTNKPLNEYCIKFIDKEIINYVNKKNIRFSEKKFKVLHSLFDNNDPILLKPFQEFNKNNNPIKSLIKELISITKKKKKSLTNKKNNEIEKKDNKKENNNDLSIDDFLKNLKKLKISNEEKEKINDLINEEDEDIKQIITEYKNNNNNIFSIEEKIKKKLNPSKYKFLLKNSSEKNITDNKKETNDFEEFKKLLQNSSYNNNEISFLIEQYSKKNTIILSIFNIYQNDSNLEEFIESINIFLKQELKIISPKNKKKINNNNNNNRDFIKTPEAVKASKDKLYLLMNPSVLKSQNVLIKQKEIISLLFHENCIDEKVYNIIDKKINEDDNGLISAFEVYAVTKDHHEFIETLNIIGSLSENYKCLFYQLINKSKFGHSEKDDLIQLYNSKNKKLYHILKNYDEDNDKSKAINSMKKLIE